MVASDKRTAIITEAIDSTIGSNSRTVGIGLTRSTSSCEMIAAGLMRNSSSIVGIAESIGGTSGARSIKITVVVVRVSVGGLTTSIVKRSGRNDSTRVRINTNSVATTNDVLAKSGGRSI